MIIDSIKLALDGYGWAKISDAYGLNADIDVGTEDVWPNGGDFVPPASAAVVNFVSSDAADASAGTGARTIKVYGLDANYAEIEETLTLNGTTPVPTARTYIMVNKVTVETAGTGGVNAGTLTGTSAASGTPVIINIPIGRGQSANAVYMVPAGKKLILLNISVSCVSTGACEIELFVKKFGGAWNNKGGFAVNSTGNSFAFDPQDTHFAVDEKALVKLRCTSTAANSIVRANWAGVLIDIEKYRSVA